MKFNRKFLLLFVLCVLFSSMIVSGQDFSNDDCLMCHGDEELTKTTPSGEEISLFFDSEKFANSVHGDFYCIDCHYDIEELPHNEELEAPDCGMCHSDIADDYMKSYHGLGLLRGDEDAPQCWDCHTSHFVYPGDDSMSTVFVLNQPEMCATCHSNPEIIEKYNIPISHPSELYKNSVHYQAAVEDNGLNGAKCSDCHSAHKLQPSSHPKSLTNKYNIPQTCSTCHEQIYREYTESVHGTSLAAGANDAPVCTDCHAEHAIKEHTDPLSTVYSSVVSKTTCGQCHGLARINAKYDMKSNVVESYNDSYHGLASRGGSVVTAHCASCHGVHHILPSSNPKSMIHKDNLVETCGSCHPGVSDKVTLGSVHLSPSPQNDRAVYYITWFYILLIFVVIGGMLFHNGIDFLHKLRSKFKGEMHDKNGEGYIGREFIRLSTNERIQHFILMGTFTILVITGFALKFPEAWWAAPFTRWEGAFAFRGWLHRVAGGLMVLLSFYHVFYIFTNRRGKRHIIEMIPNFKDLKDVIQMVKFNLGFADEKPKFAYYNYIEKAEYWALIWGTVVMSITGFILWFENISLRLFPKWITDVSTVIHYYEAVLATLAIIVWHFYFQFLDPHVYPMNTTCITGKMSEQDYKEEHGLDYEKEMQIETEDEDED